MNIPHLLRQRTVEGFIVIDKALEKQLPVPTVVVSGHRSYPGVTNIVLNHDHAAHLALEHLVQLGHERIAFIQGQPFSSDSETRWKSIERAAESLGHEIREELVATLESTPFLVSGLPRGPPSAATDTRFHGVARLQ